MLDEFKILEFTYSKLTGVSDDVFTGFNELLGHLIHDDIDHIIRIRYYMAVCSSNDEIDIELHESPSIFRCKEFDMYIDLHKLMCKYWGADYPACSLYLRID